MASAKETDPTRRKILAAMDRLISGKPLRSSGRLNVSQLALEAGIARWHLTHQHIDLKERFQAEVKSATAAKRQSNSASTELEDLKTKLAAVQQYCRELELKVALYANVIQTLSLEKSSAEKGARKVTEIASRRRGPQGAELR